MVQITSRPKPKASGKHKDKVHTPETLEKAAPETLLSPGVMMVPEATKLALGSDPEARKKSRVVSLGLPNMGKKSKPVEKKTKKRGRSPMRISSALGEDETLG